MKVLVLCDDIWHPGEVVKRGLAPLADEGFALDFVSSPKDILTVKMREAQRLLTTRKKMRMSEIAERTGFTDQKYFCRTYHAYFGHAPSRTRK